MKLLKRNIHFFVTAVGVVLVWRGVWGLADIYLLVPQPIVGSEYTLSFIVSIILGLFILVVNDSEKDIREIGQR